MRGYQRTASSPSTGASSASSKLEILAPHSGSTPRIFDPDDIPVTKLRFSSLGLYGRDVEVSTLRKAYRRVRELGAAIEMVLISGKSGTGKSYLALQLRDDIARTNAAEGLPQAFFASGKFDIQRRFEPYTAFASAFAQLCDQIVSIGCNGSKNAFVKLRDAIRDAVGSDGVVLTDIIPNLRMILGEASDAAHPSTDGREYDGPRARNRFNFVIRRFARAVCSPSRPLVLLIDDLQWADEASLELLETLTTDRELSGLLIVGCFRDDEMENSTCPHPLEDSSCEIEVDEDSDGINVTRIQVGNLGIDAVNELIAEILSLDKIQTQGLATIVQKKTHGNVFFVRQFLASLQDKGMLQYCIAKLSWQWDEDQILSETTVADNVVDLMKEKITTRIPPYAQEILQVAACLGSTFDESIMVVIANTIHTQKGGEGATKMVFEDKNLKEASGSTSVQNSMDTDGRGIVRCLQMCVDEGVLDIDVKGEGVSYRFVHDQIQHAAYSLIPENKRDTLQLCIGQALAENLGTAEFEKVLFVAVDLLNHGGGSYADEERNQVFLASLNLRAGKKAMESSAFLPAEIYLKAGIALLGPAHWEENYELSIDLLSTLAEAEYCNGKFDQMRQSLDQILARKKIPCQDKLRAYSTLIESLGAQHKFQEAIATSLSVLAQMGVHFPRVGLKSATIRDLIKTKLLLRERPTSSLSDLPIMGDEVKIKIMRIIDNLCTYTYLSSSDLFPLLILKMVRWSVRYGICKYSTVAFATYGLLLCGALGDLKQGHEFGKVALLLMEKLSARETEARTLLVVHAFIKHWVEPLHVVLTPFLHGYRVGMETGDIESAMFNINWYCLVALNTGRTLSRVEADLRAYAQQMKDYEQETSLKIALVPWQFALNLMGCSDNATLLTGEAMKQDVVLRQCNETKDEYLRGLIKTKQMWLACYFGHFNLAWKLVGETQNLAKTHLSSFIIWRNALFEGLVAFSLARKTKSRTWKKRALKVMMRVKKWTKSGNINCACIVALFEAEMAALEGKKDKAEQFYRHAISIASRYGLSHDKAIANERAGEFYVECGDMYWAAHHLGLAYQLFKAWEAHAKANQLHEKHADLLQSGH